MTDSSEKAVIESILYTSFKANRKKKMFSVSNELNKVLKGFYH